MLDLKRGAENAGQVADVLGDQEVVLHQPLDVEQPGPVGMPACPLMHGTGLLTASDPPTISHAADVRMARLRKIRPGSHLPDWGRLLDQLSAAKVCLLDASSKAAYDAGLQSQAPQQPDTAGMRRLTDPAPLPVKLELRPGVEGDLIP